MSVYQVMKRIDGTPAPAHSKQGQHPLVRAAVETGEALQKAGPTAKAED